VKKIESSKISFGKNVSDVTDPALKKVLDEVAEALHSNPSLKVTVYGHTCSDGSKEVNQKISKQRANVVGGYLLSKNVSRQQIKIVGMGQSSPIASNKTEKGKAKNRRVTFKVQ